MIQAISFDFWDTIAIDDSDEEKRKEYGLPSKRKFRESRLFLSLQKKQPHISLTDIQTAIQKCDLEFKNIWTSEMKTWTVKERLSRTFQILGVPSSPSIELIEEFESLEVDTPPDPIPGVLEVLHDLKSQYKLGIISDTIYTPGRGLRKILDAWGALELFDSLVFSDEIGASKPSQVVFQKTIEDFEIEPNTLLHVGDREEKDIFGAQRFGSKSALCLASQKRIDPRKSQANFHFDNYSQFIHLLEKNI